MGISRGRSKATTITPDLSSPVINEALERMRSSVTGLWFLYSDEKGENFFFKKEPGLSMIIIDGSLGIKENLSTTQKKDLQSKLNDAKSKFKVMDWR